MTDLRTAAQQALEAWQTATYGHPSHHKATLLAMTALRAALAQQDEPVEPVAWMYTGIKQDGTEHGPHLVWKPKYMDAMSASKGAKATPLYAAPPQRKPLTEEPAQKQVTYSTGGLHLEAGFYSEVDLRRMLKALESMNAAARRAMEETK